MESLTDRQQTVLNFLQQFLTSHGYAPSVREVAKHFRLSVSSAFEHLQTLGRKGYLHRVPGKQRVLELAAAFSAGGAALRVPLLGRVQAGRPTLAVEEVEEYLPLSPDWTSLGIDFALRVKGDSMIGAGIYDGDVVLIKRQAHAQPQEIVVALLGEEATVKRLVRRGRLMWLAAANPAYADILLDEDSRILGKVVGLIRKY
ncbi:MAG: transcriptional repressor LexA [Candidatus Omnitrophica bacterium]|nr:transcriptional repressor LexA [Candidatus Omnitrophota bacterium]